jgi:hypothetical protein
VHVKDTGDDLRVDESSTGGLGVFPKVCINSSWSTAFLYTGHNVPRGGTAFDGAVLAVYGGSFAVTTAAKYPSALVRRCLPCHTSSVLAVSAGAISSDGSEAIVGGDERILLCYPPGCKVPIIVLADMMIELLGIPDAVFAGLRRGSLALKYHTGAQGNHTVTIAVSGIAPRDALMGYVNTTPGGLRSPLLLRTGVFTVPTEAECLQYGITADEKTAGQRLFIQLRLKRSTLAYIMPPGKYPQNQELTTQKYALTPRAPPLYPCIQARFGVLCAAATVRHLTTSPVRCSPKTDRQTHPQTRCVQRQKPSGANLGPRGRLEHTSRHATSLKWARTPAATRCTPAPARRS